MRNGAHATALHIPDTGTEDVHHYVAEMHDPRPVMWVFTLSDVVMIPPSPKSLVPAIVCTQSPPDAVTLDLHLDQESCWSSHR